jgi:hypothetical protein
VGVSDFTEYSKNFGDSAKYSALTALVVWIRVNSETACLVRQLAEQLRSQSRKNDLILFVAMANPL